MITSMKYATQISRMCEITINNDANLKPTVKKMIVVLQTGHKRCYKVVTDLV